MSTDDNEILNIAIRLEYISHSVQSLYYNVSNRNLLRGILKKVHNDICTTIRFDTVKGYGI